MEPKPTLPVPGNPREGSTYYIFLPTFRSYIEYLWNSTEVEDALVAQAGQVGNNIRDMPQRISDKQVETGESRIELLGLGKVLQTTSKLTPSLHRDTEDNGTMLFKPQVLPSQSRSADKT